MLEILRQVLREPVLPAEEFDLIKRERLAMVEQMRTEPSMLAPRLLQRELNPYSRDDIRYVPTVEESIECATELVVAGYTRAFCTPHIWPTYKGVSRTSVPRWCKALQRILA